MPSSPADASKYFPRFCINDNYFSASSPLAAHTKGIKQNFVPLSNIYKRGAAAHAEDLLRRRAKLKVTNKSETDKQTKVPKVCVFVFFCPTQPPMSESELLIFFLFLRVSEPCFS